MLVRMQIIDERLQAVLIMVDFLAYLFLALIDDDHGQPLQQERIFLGPLTDAGIGKASR